MGIPVVQGCQFQVGLAQIGLAQVSQMQVGLAQVGIAQVGIVQVGKAQVGTVQEGTIQVSTTQVGIRETNDASAVVYALYQKCFLQEPQDLRLTVRLQCSQRY
jgi:hypothetical protein